MFFSMMMLFDYNYSAKSTNLLLKPENENITSEFFNVSYSNHSDEIFSNTSFISDVKEESATPNQEERPNEVSTLQFFLLFWVTSLLIEELKQV